MLQGKNIIDKILFLIFISCIFVIFSFSRADKYLLAIIASSTFSIYMLRYGLYVQKTPLFRLMFGIMICIFISSISLYPEYYHTSFLGLFSFSLLGVESYMMVYIYMIRHPYDMNIIKKIAYAFALIGVLAYLYAKFVVLGRDGFQDMGEVANTFYYVVMPLPLLLIFLKPIYKVIWYLLVFLAVFYTYKRSGILIMSFMGIPLFLSIYKNPSRYPLVKKISLILGLLFIAFYIKGQMASEEWLRMTERFEALEDDGGSGRMLILEMFWANISDYTVWQYLFGHGYGNFAVNYTYASPHNDYVDMFYSYGILGFSIFLLIVFYLVRLVVKRREKLPISVWAFLCVFFVLNFTGGIFFYYNTSCILLLFLGVMDVLYRGKKRDLTVRTKKNITYW